MVGVFTPRKFIPHKCYKSGGNFFSLGSQLLGTDVSSLDKTLPPVLRAPPCNILSTFPRDPLMILIP